MKIEKLESELSKLKQLGKRKGNNSKGRWHNKSKEEMIAHMKMMAASRKYRNNKA